MSERAPRPAAVPADVTIARLGAQGDGVAETDAGPLYVPFALPGETWRLAPDEPPQMLTASPQRRPPPCRHFGTCGGCVAQHMSDDLYAAWKHGVVVQAFAHRGIDAKVAPLRRIASASRRRAALGVTREQGRIVIGFRQEGAHRLVDMTECVILDPAIVTALPALRALADAVLPAVGSGGRLVVTRLDAGLDISIEIDAQDRSAETLQRLAGLARAAGIVRLQVGGATIVDNVVRLTINGVVTAPPAGIFLQAAPQAEQAMTELIMAGLPKARSVADLFCGIGTFSFALARRARVTAIDGDKRALATLDAAARHAQGLKPIECKVRDLFREPLTERELAAFDAVVVDPPRAGAEAQCVRLAKSKVPVIAAVSCNPATLARDARILLDGGYRLASVTPIDQFVYSPHIEAVALFRR